MELVAPRVTVAGGGLGGRGPAVFLQRSGISADSSAQAVEAKQAGVVRALPDRETRPVEERSSGTDELIHRHWRGGGGLATHPVGNRSHEHCDVAHRGVQGVGL
ncbi:hypothetical protein [Streptomyces sp. NPDC002205]|uniref:hypothetical protein n=1 Tax=Streptomyces sp. NPDC002205 TaxID=3154411 RepID=UPI003331B8B6